jgi:N6-adenosine-specific RNA methylase IME4
MSMEALKALPVANWAADDCVLFLWACDPLLPEALDLVAAWGFKFRTIGFYWLKQNAKSSGLFTGLGYWTRSGPELCLLATKGRPQRLAKDVKKAVLSPRREHSRKPDEIIGLIERLVGGPYLEMFARARRDGWDAYGNETDKFSEESSDDLFVF